MNDERHSEAEQKDLIKDPDAKALREAENGLVQYEQILELFHESKKLGAQWKLRPRIIIQLQEAALRDIHPLAGTYRNSSIAITGSQHAPPHYYDVPEEVAALCEYINENWTTKTAVHLAAFVLWKLNWIHPFSDGNGRTARAVSYLVLLSKLETQLPGTQTIPEQIAANKGPYYDALEAADAASNSGEINVSVLEQMLEAMLIRQLTREPALPSFTQEKLNQVFKNRIDKAPSQVLLRAFATEAVKERLWTIGDCFVLHISSDQSLAAAEARFRKHSDPFPHLICDASAQIEVSASSSGEILLNRSFDVGEGFVISLSPDAFVALASTKVTWTDHGQSCEWQNEGALYLFRRGTTVTDENLDTLVDLMLARHLQACMV
jgi:fido (protein-threonine AMPylation protein)